MNNPFHSQGPELDSEADIASKAMKRAAYRKQLDQRYGNSFPAKVWKAVLIFIEKYGRDESIENSGKNYMQA